MFVQKMIKIFVRQKTVMSISLGQVVSLYVFTCIIIILENRPVGQVWKFGGSPKRICKVPQGWATCRASYFSFSNQEPTIMAVVLFNGELRFCGNCFPSFH